MSSCAADTRAVSIAAKPNFRMLPAMRFQVSTILSENRDVVSRCFYAILSCLAFACVGSATAAGLVVVDAAELDRYWRTAPGVESMQVGDKRETAFGCIAIGFVIDSEGRVTAARPLRLAFGKDVRPRRARELGIAISRAASALPAYAPATENPNHAEVFTVLAIPVFGRGLWPNLDEPRRELAVERLRPSCEIADLAAWVDAHDMRKDPEIEVAPEIDIPIP